MSLSDKIIDRIKEYKRFKTDTELAIYLKVKPNTVTTWRKRDSIPSKKIIAFCECCSVSLDYIFTGRGKVTSEGPECDNHIYNVGMAEDDQEVAELVAMVKKVLKSGSDRADTLSLNIRASHQGLIKDREIEDRVAALEKNAHPPHKISKKIRNGDDQDRRGDILKKRRA